MHVSGTQFITDTIDGIIKSVPNVMYRDRYLYLCLVTGTFCSNTCEGGKMGKGAICMNLFTNSAQVLLIRKFYRQLPLRFKTTLAISVLCTHIGCIYLTISIRFLLIQIMMMMSIVNSGVTQM